MLITNQYPQDETWLASFPRYQPPYPPPTQHPQTYKIPRKKFGFDTTASMLVRMLVKISVLMDVLILNQ